jgi:hypothetical protein
MGYGWLADVLSLNMYLLGVALGLALIALTALALKLARRVSQCVAPVNAQSKNGTSARQPSFAQPLNAMEAGLRGIGGRSGEPTPNGSALKSAEAAALAPAAKVGSRPGRNPNNVPPGQASALSAPGSASLPASSLSSAAVLACLGLELGAAASVDLHAFVQPFVPLAAASEDAAKLRNAAFRSADPNGNGLCSLAELEGFVLQKLLAAFPKDPKQKDHRGKPLERGRDLFDLFRPCYLRAFSDAKDYKADSGTVLEGTKSATNDDFVSKGEFRFFCAYVCIYAAMVRGPIARRSDLDSIPDDTARAFA